MRAAVATVFCALLLAAFGGCVPGGGAMPVTISRGDRQLAIEIFQDGRKVAPAAGLWKLKARPFEIELAGDVRWASYHAAAGEDLAKRLAALDRPLVFFPGTVSPTTGNRLQVLLGRAETDEAAEVFTADEQFFIKQWGAKEAQAAELTARLVKALGSAPAIACFGHFPFPSGSAAENPRYFLNDAASLGGERLRGRFRVETVSEGSGDRPPGTLPRIHLLVFVESPIDRDFRRVSWAHLVLEFATEGPAGK